MESSPVARIVDASRRVAGVLVVAMLMLGAVAADYAVNHFAMNTRTETLISAQAKWRKREIAYDAAFPLQNDLIVVVIDGATPERAEEATQSLTDALGADRTLLPYVHRPDDGAYFAHDGLLFLSTAEVKTNAQNLIRAQPFLGALAVDPSLRGIADTLSTAVAGVTRGRAKLEDLDGPIAGVTRSLGGVLAGRLTYLSWQTLLTGTKADLRQTRKFIEIRPRLDYGNLIPGERATDAIRQAAQRLGLDAAHGARVRLTGSIPLADDEFASLTERARLMATLMMIAVLAMLWFAVRSPRLIFAILLTVFTGLTLTTAIGLLAVGRFNLISVAFIPLFVGLGVDFGIQFCVRYRHERHLTNDLDRALRRTGGGIGPALFLAAAATAAGFYSFLPTSYRGVAELGFIAGTGMMITFVLSITLLPALLKLLSPAGEPEAIGFKLLAPFDAFLHARRRIVVFAALAAALVGIAALPLVDFDFNPLDLRSPKVESVSTALDLMKDPDTSPSTLNVLVPSHDAAVALSARLARLPEISHTMSLDSFVPDDQPQKLAILADAQNLIDPTINPFMTKPAPGDADIVTSFRSAAGNLDAAAGSLTTPAARHARALAQDLRRLAAGPESLRVLAATALVPGLETTLDEVRAGITPHAVTLRTLPADLIGEWVTTGGLYRVEAFPRIDTGTNAGLRDFTTAVRRVAPDATGEPIVILESGKTIVRAFIQAGILSFFVIALMLYWALRSLVLTLLALAPLVLAGIATMATCVVIGLPLNYANIIALPLLLGIGVAFDIYFVMAWRAGERNLLGSSLTRAVVLSAGTTASAFGTLWLSSHPGTASMGELLAISLGWILVAILVLLPALLDYALPAAGLAEPADRHAPAAGAPAPARTT
jgi:hopanoid biosynthesis associated RND transporter like protein HpnN